MRRKTGVDEFQERGEELGLGCGSLWGEVPLACARPFDVESRQRQDLSDFTGMECVKQRQVSSLAPGQAGEINWLTLVFMANF